jgi:hypothetical protein
MSNLSDSLFLMSNLGYKLKKIISILKNEFHPKKLFLFSSIIFIAFFIFCLSAQASQPNADCMNWLKAGKVKPGTKNCERDCVVLMTEMGTFMCPNQCDILCKDAGGKSILEKVVYYPGLTPAEKKLVEKNPEDALNAFIQKTRAEWSSGRNFPEQGLSDEADAFRHFIWAGLLTKELGSEKAKQFLSAHEANPLQRDSERDMDQFNNEKGSSTAQNLISNKKWNLENLEKSGLDSLRSKDLKVLNPGLKIPEVPK